MTKGVKKVSSLLDKANRHLEAAAAELNKSNSQLTAEEMVILPQLQRTIRELREMMIIQTLACGFTGAEVAAMHHLSPARISQIKTKYQNRNKK